jgi:hypothetical protein
VPNWYTPRLCNFVLHLCVMALARCFRTSRKILALHRLQSWSVNRSWDNGGSSLSGLRHLQSFVRFNSMIRPTLGVHDQEKFTLLTRLPTRTSTRTACEVHRSAVLVPSARCTWYKADCQKLRPRSSERQAHTVHVRPTQILGNDGYNVVTEEHDTVLLIDLQRH